MLDELLDELAYNALQTGNPFDALGMDATNYLSARWHHLAKETPGKTWWNATAMHPRIFQALRMDRTEDGAIYAAAPFRLHIQEERASILIALPCPPLFSSEGDDWLSIDTVLSWNPRTNTAHVMGDAVPQVAGSAHDVAAIYCDPFEYFRALAEARAQWITSYMAIDGDWHRRPSEPDLTPGLLLIGKPDEVTWPIHEMSKNMACHGIDPAAINRAIIRQARLPRAFNPGQSSMSRAA